MLNVHELLKWFQLKYPEIVKDMIGANHHYSQEILNPYHIEGDVWTHSMMVLLNASKVAPDFYLGNELLVSALLHDIGKPTARFENHEKKRVSFFNHDQISMFMSVLILEAIEKHFDVKLSKRLILEAIALHTEPFKNPKLLSKRLAHNENLYSLLVELSKADREGRFYDGVDGRNAFKPEILEPMISLRSTPEIVCMVGLPCSGKSTYIKENLKDYEVISRDNIVMELAEKGFTYNKAFMTVDQDEVDKRLNKLKSQLSKADKNVVVDMTNMSRKSRKRALNQFKKHCKSAIVMMPNMNVIAARNKDREGKNIPKKVLDKMVSAFYPPLYDEFEEIEWIFQKG